MENPFEDLLLVDQVDEALKDGYLGVADTLHDYIALHPEVKTIDELISSVRNNMRQSHGAFLFKIGENAYKSVAREAMEDALDILGKRLEQERTKTRRAIDHILKAA